MVTVKTNGRTYRLNKKEFLNFMLRLKARCQAERDIESMKEEKEEEEE